MADDQNQNQPEEKKDTSAGSAQEKPKQEAKKEEAKKGVKLEGKVGKIAEEIERLTVLEVAELAKHLEEKFGVSAMPMMAAGAAPAAAGVAGEPAEEKTTFNVVLTASGDNKLGVIKAVREVKPDLGLMDAKK